MPKRGAALLAAAGTLMAGCAGVPAPQPPVVRIVEAAQPSAAIPLGQFLPTAQELSDALGTGPNGFMGEVVQGDSDMLLRSVGEAQATPADCVGPAYRLEHVVYDAGSVQSVASGTWAGGGFDGPPVTGFFGVVQMAGTTDAAAFFASMTEQWRRCNGQTMTLHQPERGADDVTRVGDVSFDDRVVSATVLHASGAAGSTPSLRAVGLAGDCIVEVELSDPRAVGGAAPAVGVAELILDKISSSR